MTRPTPSGPGHTGPQIDWPRALAENDRWLRTVVTSQVRDPDAVDEIMQEVALAAVRQAAPISDAARVGPWLYQVAVRQALLYRRRLGRDRRRTDRFAERFRPRDEDTHTPEPLAWLLADERQRLVREAIARLPRRDAEILLLKYTEGWSYRQLAARLGISHGAVESRLHRARRRLRGELSAVDVLEVK